MCIYIYMNIHVCVFVYLIFRSTGSKKNLELGRCITRKITQVNEKNKDRNAFEYFTCYICVAAK